MEELTIEVQKREETGDGACRRLRRAGWVPGVVYGGGRDPLPIQIERKPLLEILAKGGGENRVFLLRLAGTDKSRHTMIRDLQVDPVSRQVIHVDFQRVLLDAKVRVKVRVEIAGTAWGVKNEAGMLEFVSREVEVECLPTRIPDEFRVDVSELHVGQHIRVADLVLPEGVEVRDEPDRVIVAIAHGRVSETAAEPGTEAAAAATEPEVVRRGKAENPES